MRKSTRTKAYRGSITKRGATWRVRLCVGGVYRSFTAHGSKTEAQNFATLKHAELSQDHTRAKAGLPGPIRFTQLVAEFTDFELPTRSAGTQESYKASLETFRVFFVDKLGDPFVRDVRRSHVQTFLEWRRTHRVRTAEAPSGHTVAKDFRVLRRVFSYGVSKDHLDSNPCGHVRPAKTDPRTPEILSAEQLELLLTKCESNPMLHLYVLLLAETGMRAYSEALALQWDDIDLGDGAITIRSTTTNRNKSGKTRVVPMTARLHTAMREHAARFRLAQRSSHLFTHELTKRNSIAGEPVRTFRGSFEAAARKAKLPAGFRAHDLRHRRVTTWMGESKSPALIQLAMGHASISTTMGYSNLTAAHLRSLVAEPAIAPAKEAVR